MQRQPPSPPDPNRRRRFNDESRDAARRPDPTSRQLQALTLRRAGATYAAIAIELGVTRARAHQLVRAARERLGIERRPGLPSVICSHCGERSHHERCNFCGQALDRAALSRLHV